MASHPSFVVASKRIPETDREQKADEELVLRFFAVISSRSTFAGNVREWLDHFMETLLFEGNDASIDSSLFRDFFNFIDEKFQGDAFCRWRDGAAIGRLAPAYFEAVCGGLIEIYEVLKSKDSADLQTALQAAFEDTRFQVATGPGANNKTKMEARIAVLKEHFVGL